MNSKIKGKQILFIGQVFYDYHTKILNELENLGAIVTFLPNKFHGDGNISSLDLIGHLRKFAMPYSKNRYKTHILKSIEDKKFDYLFCIGGFSITPSLMLGIRQLNPGIKTIMYFWDSFKTWNYSSLLNEFDSVYSFDPKDSENYEVIKYLPLFYTSEYVPDPTIIKDIDLLYVGSISILSRNRFKILQQANQFALENKLKAFIWLFYAESSRSSLGKIQTFFKKITIREFRDYLNLVRNKEIKFLKTTTLKRDEIIELMRRARCIIDIPIPDQSGLTIRTIETLALNNKLITTNPQIKNEPFYDECCISVCDENELRFDSDFITKKDDCKLDVSHLELKNWLLTMF